MKSSLILVLILTLAQPALGQGMMEMGGTGAVSAGLGAGLAASLGHGRIVQQSYEAMAASQQSLMAQTRAINQYLALDTQFEKAKQWAYSEKTLSYVLSIIAHRDGPGSPNSAPVLARLAQVSKAQNKLDQAIGYQKTVVAIVHGAKKPDPNAVLLAQRELSGMLLDKKDYLGAQSALQQEAALFDQFPSLPREQLKATLSVYGKVLQHFQETASPVAASVSNPNAAPSQTAATLQGSADGATAAPENHQLAVDTTAGNSAAAAGAPVQPPVVPVIEAPAPAVQSAAPPAQESTQAGLSGRPSPAPAKLDHPEALTPEQEALKKANLAGSEPLPSEMETLKNSLDAPNLTAAQRAALKANVTGGPDSKVDPPSR